MEDEPAIKTPETKGPVNYAEKIAGQEALIGRLSEDYKKNPSPELQLDLKRKTDALLHLKNLAKGSPKARAQSAAKTARLSALSKAYA